MIRVFPAVGYGGSEDIENIKIVKTIPYIDICTQTIGEFEVADKY